MNERPFGHAAGHARHDRLLVARFTAGETDATETPEARRLVENCSDCSRLADDMRLLRTSLAAMPTPRRTRNFRLSTEQAERLRGNSLERFLRRLAMPGLAMLRPVAGVAVAMGLTIAVVGTSLPVAMAPAHAPAPTDTTRLEYTEVPTPPPPAGSPGDQVPAAAATNPPGNDSGMESGGTTSFESEDVTTHDGSGRGKVDETEETVVLPPSDVLPPSTAAPIQSDTTRVVMIYSGVTLATISFAVLLLAWFARRRLEDPLLR